MRGNQNTNNVPSTQGLMGDMDLANNLRQQAAKMAAEAKGLIAESERLLKEAASMDPTPAIETKVTKTRKTKTKVSA